MCAGSVRPTPDKRVFRYRRIPGSNNSRMEGKEATPPQKRVVDQWKPHYHMCQIGRTNAEKKSISLWEDPRIQP